VFTDLIKHSLDKSEIVLKTYLKHCAKEESTFNVKKKTNEPKIKDNMNICTKVYNIIAFYSIVGICR
jgi:hypothetical protein